jgi:hypothetical protein
MLKDISKWTAGMLKMRMEKDAFFGTHPHSPIPYEKRRDFKRLDYYPVDPAYRFELELHEHDKKEELTMQTSTGDKQHYLRWGEFRFKIGDADCVLQAYKADRKEEGLFVPFRDATSDKETYGAGRYLHLGYYDKLPDGKWVIDFNMAYNPYCAYAQGFSCPFTPPENWLEAAIPVGEKIWAGHEVAVAQVGDSERS